MCLGDRQLVTRYLKVQFKTGSLLICLLYVDTTLLSTALGAILSLNDL